MSEKTGLKAFGEGRRDILNIDPRIIVVEPGFNSRDFSMPENQEHVQSLKDSIVRIGVKEPLTVRMADKKVTLVGGECRLRAVLLAIEEGAAIKTVPCQAESPGTNDAQRTAEQVVRNSGKRFAPLEMARNAQKLANFGWNRQQIADTYSVSVSYVAQLFEMLEMPEEVQSLVRSGVVAAGLALSTVRSQGEADGVLVLRDAVADVQAKADAEPPTKKKAKKIKATLATVKKAAEKRGTGKATGLKLNADKTKTAITFMKWCRSRAANIGEVREEAQRVLDEIIG